MKIDAKRDFKRTEIICCLLYSAVLIVSLVILFSALFFGLKISTAALWVMLLVWVSTFAVAAYVWRKYKGLVERVDG